MIAALVWFLVSGVSAFPHGRCYDRSCAVSPFNLTKTVNNGSHLCFRLDQRTQLPSKDPYKCFERFSKSVPKIVLETKPRCSDAIRQVTVDGVPKKGGVYFETHDSRNLRSELILTSLVNVKNGTEVCVFLKEPCDKRGKFCKKFCKFALFDPVKHDCCPTCPFL